MYFSGVHLGGCKGKASSISVLSGPLRKEGIAKVAARGDDREKETLYSCGKVEKEGQVVVKANEFQVKDTVGEIWVQQSLCTGMLTFAGRKAPQRDVHGYVSTGELGFLSSQNGNLYVVAPLS